MTDRFVPRHSSVARASGIAVTLLSTLMLGACAGGAGLPTGQLFQAAATQDSGAPTQQATSTSAAFNSELERATAYWGERFAKQPTDLEAALSFAKNLRAMGQNGRAISVLQQASLFHGNNRDLASEYGRLALELGQVEVAHKVLAIADDPSQPDWRVVSARGAALAKKGLYAEAIPQFERALSLKHNHPSILNNLALAYAMNGDPVRAEGLLRQATATGVEGKKVRQNLALVLGLQGKYDEATEMAARDIPLEQARERVASIRNMVKLDPVAATHRNAAEALADAWSKANGLKPTDTAAAPTSRTPQAYAQAQ